MDVDQANKAWTDMQAKFDLRNQQCARIQEELIDMIAHRRSIWFG